MAKKPEYDAFVVARWAALLRTAYLLTHDEGRAEDLLQTALTKLWFAWDRVEGDPEPYVRRILATTQTSWWRRRWRSELVSERVADVPDPRPEGLDQHVDLWSALGRLPARQRAVVVLRYYEDLSVADADASAESARAISPSRAVHGGGGGAARARR